MTYLQISTPTSYDSTSVHPYHLSPESICNAVEIVEERKEIVAQIDKLGETCQNAVIQVPSDGESQCLLELLNSYWTKFQGMHEVLKRERSIQMERHSLNEIYETVKRTYIKSKGCIYDIKSKCSQSQSSISNSISGTSRVDPIINENVRDSRNYRAPLPRLQVSHFSGGRKNWEAFRDLFQVVVHESRI